MEKQVETRCKRCEFARQMVKAGCFARPYCRAHDPSEGQPQQSAYMKRKSKSDAEIIAGLEAKLAELQQVMAQGCAGDDCTGCLQAEIQRKAWKIERLEAALTQARERFARLGLDGFVDDIDAVLPTRPADGGQAQ